MTATSATQASGTTPATSASTTKSASATSGSSSTGFPACTALLCEDFEGGDTLDPKWTEDVGYHADHFVAVVDDEVAHGARAFHAHVASVQGGFARIREMETFPQLADELWGRAFFRTNVPLDAGHTGFIWAMSGDANVLEIGYGNGNYQLTWYPMPGAENPAGYDVAVPRDQWVCLEWHFDRLASPQIEVFVDGDLAVDYARDDADIPAFTALQIGIDNHGPTSADNDVWLDDIAIDAARIGCPP